jgi:hypothetical protein
MASRYLGASWHWWATECFAPTVTHNVRIAVIPTLGGTATMVRLESELLVTDFPTLENVLAEASALVALRRESRLCPTRLLE